MPKTVSTVHAELNNRLVTSGFRFTPQREHVYQVLLDTRDHPTAEEVFLRAKGDRSDISLATVYNCLDALVKCRLVRQVNFERGATRYCPNMQEHSHFYCQECGQVFDMAPPINSALLESRIPPGFEVTHFETSIQGLCPECSGPR